MEELLTILNDVDDSIDWEHEEGLIDNRILDSFGSDLPCGRIGRDF